MKEGFFEWLMFVRQISSRMQKWTYGTIYAMYLLHYPENDILYGDIDEITAKYSQYKGYGDEMAKKVRRALLHYRSFCGMECVSKATIGLTDKEVSFSPDEYVNYCGKYGIDRERALLYYRHLLLVISVLKDEDYVLNNMAVNIIDRYSEMKGINPTSSTKGVYFRAIFIYQGLAGKNDYLGIQEKFYEYLLVRIKKHMADYYSNVLIRFLASGVTDEVLTTLCASEILDKYIDCLTKSKTKGSLFSYREGIYYYQKYRLGHIVPNTPEYRVVRKSNLNYTPPNKTNVDGYEDFYQWCVDCRRYSAEITRHYISVIRGMISYYNGDESKILTGDTRNVVDNYITESGKSLSLRTKNRGYRVALRSYREFKGVEV